MQRECVSCGRTGRYWTNKAGRDVWRCAACGLIWVPDGLLVGEGGASIYEGDKPIFLVDGNEQRRRRERLEARHQRLELRGVANVADGAVGRQVGVIEQDAAQVVIADVGDDLGRLVDGQATESHQQHLADAVAEAWPRA